MSEMNNPDLKIEPLFSKETYEMYRAMGLSEEDIAVLERAESLCNLADILPEDPKTAFDKIEALPSDPGQALDTLNKMANSDPESFAQIMATVEAIDQVIEDGEN